MNEWQKAGSGPALPNVAFWVVLMGGQGDRLRPLAAFDYAYTLVSMKQSAVSYRVKDKLIIGYLVRTSMGLGLEVDPRPLMMTTSNDDVAMAIGEALKASEKVIAHPTRDQWKGLFQPFIRAAGVRSFKAFMTDAIRVGIDRYDAQLKLEPHRNLGPKMGFEPIPSDVIVLPAGDLVGAVSELKALLDGNGR